MEFEQGSLGVPGWGILGGHGEERSAWGGGVVWLGDGPVGGATKGGNEGVGQRRGGGGATKGWGWGNEGVGVGQRRRGAGIKCLAGPLPPSPTHPVPGSEGPKRGVCVFVCLCVCVSNT